MKKRSILVLASILMIVMAAVALFTANVSAAYEEYGLYIGGKQVTSNNLSGQGWRFEPETYTLVLNGFEITSGGHFHKKINDGTTWLYSFIYVDEARQMNLTIRTEGKESTIGYGTMAGNPEVRSSTGDGTYESYFGIYNRGGNVTITGSAKLSIYTSQLCINTKKMIIVDECRAPVSMHAYAVGIDCEDLIVKGGSKFSVYCGYSGGTDNESAITARQSISLYDTSELYADVERWSSSTKGYIAALSCPEGTVNVYGGKLTAVCHMGGKQSDKFPECFAIRAGTLNISGGGVVDARIRTASGQKNYRESITVGQYNSSTGTINFKGKGVLRVGVEMKNPNGGQRLYPESFNHLNDTVGYTSDLKMEDNEIIYLEYTSYEREGIFLHEFGNNTHWSYYRHPSMERNNYLFFFDLNDAIVSGKDYSVYSVSGTQSMMPYVESGEIPAITVEAGELTLWLKTDYTHNFTKPVEVKKGATLKIYGFGTANGLDIRGEGTVIFQCGTVTGKVQKSLKMIVEGGNVNVEYDGQATDANGVKVWKQPYRLGNEDASFTKVSQISVKNGRSYSVYGTYPINGREVYLWMQSAEELESLSAVPSGSSSSLTLRGNPGDPLWLTLFQSIATNAQTLYVSAPGASVTIRPFTNAPTAEQMKEYKLIWSYSDDGLNWTTIENPVCDSECQLTYTVPTGESWINRTFRCELRKTATNEQLGVYTATLHLANLKIVNETPFSENKRVTLRLTEGTLPPDGQNITIERIRWHISDDGGKTYELHKDANGKEAYSFTVTAAMDGRMIRCEAQLSDGTKVVSEAIKVEVTDRLVVIKEQPESITIKLPTGTNYRIKVIAEYATSYQWQVSKRTYPGEDVPFEDIPGANKYYYSSGSSPRLYAEYRYYAYRCVVKNEFSEATTNEVTMNLLFDPYFYDVKGFNTTIREGGDALFETKIMGGNPLVATDVYWEVYMREDNGYVRLSEVEALKGCYTEESITETVDGVTYHTSMTLKFTNVPLSMNGWSFRCIMTYGDSWVEVPFSLTVQTQCQQEGHDFSEATCTTLSTCSRCGATQGVLLPHQGGTATCKDKAVCEVCGNEYGEFAAHTYKTTWSSDADSHWHACSICDIRTDEEAHTGGDHGHLCDVCGATLSTCADEDNDHKCDVCGATLSTCTDGNNDHKCDICGATLSTCADGNNDHKCDVCGATLSACADEDNDHKCDVCDATLSSCTDGNSDHKCDVCGATLSTCADGNNDHKCDICGATLSTCADEDNDHKCDVCGATLSSCTDGNSDHKCDVCGATLSTCADGNNDHNCDVCGATLSTCADGNNDHRCDVCGAVLSSHSGGEATCKDKAVCEICGTAYGELAAHSYETAWSSDANGHWHACSVCGVKSDEAAHTPGAAATETTPQTCTVCDYVIKAALGHTHKFTEKSTDAKYLKSPATCTAKAVYYYSCTCGETGTETFEFGEMSAHDYNPEWASKPEWSGDADKHWRACAVCGAKADEAAHNFAWKIDKEASVTEAGEKHEECTVCGYKKASVAIDKLALRIVDGNDARWTPGSEEGLIFRTDASVAFGEVLVDGKSIAAANYDVCDSPVIVELRPRYLATLTEGEHTITIRTAGGDATAKFTVEAASVTPPTDSAGVWVWIIVGAVVAFGVGVTAAVFVLRKRKVV